MSLKKNFNTLIFFVRKIFNSSLTFYKYYNIIFIKNQKRVFELMEMAGAAGFEPAWTTSPVLETGALNRYATPL